MLLQQHKAEVYMLLYEAQNVVCMKAKRLKICKLLESAMLSEFALAFAEAVLQKERIPFRQNFHVSRSQIWYWQTSDQNSNQCKTS